MSTSLPDYNLPCWDSSAEAIGELILHERAQLPPVVLGQCEHLARPGARCPAIGLLMNISILGLTSFLCPRHGADLSRAVRRYPRRPLPADDPGERR